MLTRKHKVGLNRRKYLDYKYLIIYIYNCYLDVQLKPHHIPFKMVKQWPMLIERYSMASDEDKLKGGF